MHPIHHAEADPQKIAHLLASTGEAVTYRQLDDRANQGAHLFRGLGLQRGDVVALMMENTVHNLEIAWAAQRAGLYLTAVSTKLSLGDVGYILRDSGAKLLIVSTGLVSGALRQLIERFDLDVFVSEASPMGFPVWSQARDAMPDNPIADESPGGDMLYSSGTTGRPKGVKPPLPEGDVHQTTALAEMGASLYGMDETTVYLSPAPLYHAAPLRWAMAVQRLGGTVVILDKFDAETALMIIERYGITHAQWVPTHFVRMLKLPERVRRRYDLSSLRAVFHAAAPCPPDIKRQMIAWWGPIIHEYYSGTENPGLTAISAAEWLERPGSVGRAILGEVKIRAEDGRVAPPGETGTIYFAGGPTFEYHNDPEKTARSRSPEGWATLGDVGRLDEDGYLYLTDRKDFMIISGGVNIYPQEVENVLAAHPKIVDVAVVGAPDDEMGETVVAVIQPVNWQEAGPELAAELLAFARAALGGVKAPRRVEFRRELPRQPTGKLFKRLIRDEMGTAPVADASKA